MIQKDDPRLTAFVLGELEAADFVQLEEAIEASPELQQIVAEIKQTIATLEASFKQETPLSLPSSVSFDTVISATVAKENSSSPTAQQPSVARWAIAVSVVGLAAIGSAFYFDANPKALVSGPSAPEIPIHSESAMEATELEGDAAEDFLSRMSRQVGRVRVDSDGRPTTAPILSDDLGETNKSARTTQDSTQLSVTPRIVIGQEEPSGVSLRRMEEKILEFRKVHANQESQQPRRSEIRDSPSLNPDGDRFESIIDNPYKRVAEEPLSTFSIDVDTASYSKIRQSIFQAHRLPRPDAVRVEEMVNYFHYDYEGPTDQHPFATQMEVASCPWNAKHRLARIAIQGRKMQTDQRPPCNLVFLLDTSGSMNAANKMPLVKEGMKMLLEQLDQKDHVAIVTYAGSAGLVLPSTSATKYGQIEAALARLNAGGSTNGGEGIELAYQVARENFIKDGVNRVILCTDGDFNVGTTGTDSLVSMVESESKTNVFLSVMGFGMGNLNDSMLEQISGRGNGNYSFIDSRREAKKVLVDQASGTLVTIAKDVKIQVEFNPTQVAGYRLIGYENRVLAKEDFNDDKIDAGEIGAGHQVTAIYEWIPTGVEDPLLRPEVDELKYQPTQEERLAAANDSPDLLTVKLRYKQPESDISTRVDFSVLDTGKSFSEASEDFRFAAAVASFGMQLRRSPYRGDWNYQSILETANSAKGKDLYEIRQEFVELVQQAFQLNGEE